MNFIPERFFLMKTMSYIAHRGASLQAPENTLSALCAAKKASAEWVECDVMLTRDDVPIVFHDETVDRTTNGHGKVSEFTYAEISVLDAGSYFSPAFLGEKIPTLSEWLRCADRLSLSLNIELKPNDGRYPELVEAVLAELKKYPSFQGEKLLISSFNQACLLEFSQRAPSVRLGLLMNQWRDDWYITANIMNCFSINVNYTILNEQRVRDIHATNRKIFAYTVNDVETMERLKIWGVDGIFSDIFLS